MPSPPPAPERVAPTPEAFAELWPAVLESLQEEAPHLAAVLQTARPSQVADSELTIAWPESAGFFKRKAEDPASKEKIVRAIHAVTGTSLRLAYELRDDAELAAAPVERLSEEELVKRFVEEFAKTRPHREVFMPETERRKGSRTPGTGRTGREEWT